jgi:hypothetical protein
MCATRGGNQCTLRANVWNAMTQTSASSDTMIGSTSASQWPA